MTQVVVSPNQYSVVISGEGRTVVVTAGGPTVVISPSGPPGPAGAGTSYTHSQSVGAAEWVVNHNLGFRPVVSVYDPGGNQVLAEVLHISANQLRVYFASAQTGTVRCI